MTIKNIVIIDGEEIDMNELEDKVAFAQSVNERILLDRSYIREESA